MCKGVKRKRPYKLNRDEFAHLLFFTERTARRLWRERTSSDSSEIFTGLDGLLKEEIENVVKAGRAKRAGKRTKRRKASEAQED